MAETSLVAVEPSTSLGSWRPFMYVVGFVLAMGAVAGVTVARWFMRWRAGVRAARALVASAHVVEVRTALLRLRQAALDAIDAAPVRSTDDPRVFVSSAGLIVTYAMRPHGRAVLHHIAISHAGGHTPHDVGAMFAMVAIADLALPIERANLAVLPSTIHHAQIALDPLAHLAAVEAPTPSITVEDVPELLRQAALVGAGVTWRHPVASPPERERAVAGDTLTVP